MSKKSFLGSQNPSRSEVVLGCLFIVFLVAFLLVLSYAITGWVLFMGWNLLVVPAFGAGLATWEQGVVAAVVLSVVGSFFRQSGSKA